MFDITQLSANETSTVELVGGDDEPLYDDKGARLSITVYGPGTKVYQRAQARQQNLIMDKLKKRGRMDQSAEEKALEQAEFLAACTVSFNGFAYPPAKGLEGAAYFRKAYEDPTIGFIAAQVGAHIGDWANFTKSSAAS
ncbi:MAG: hypothetical protein IPF97_14915 [Sphingomonadales bacterium]|jgi:hypothetical protein|uniref:hypothetical protein n=1 Tax=Brevundimonas sp. TaxID=1871086 RepID=UPI0022C488EB|nr:hypothetical protein [Brevundimonas sp.]MBK6492938.1 hypothetical protein [Sphingomonadales bacterium]MCZ8192980.1 hypothetical protein [Brevundimonas sp.]